MLIRVEPVSTEIGACPIGARLSDDLLGGEIRVVARFNGWSRAVQGRYWMIDASVYVG